MTWEKIVELAKRVEKHPKDKDLALMLASHVLDFDGGMRGGGQMLPASWESAAVHLAGYHKPAR